MEYTCSCGRYFSTSRGLSYHRNACQYAQERAGAFHFSLRRSILGKRCREEETAPSIQCQVNGQPSSLSSTSSAFASLSPLGSENSAPPNPGPLTEDLDLNTAIANRKRARTRTLPRRYLDAAPDRKRSIKKAKDILPEGLSGLPPSGVAADTASAVLSSESSGGAICGSGSTSILDSSKNAFGLFRRYSGLTFSSHDPDAGFTESLFGETSNDLPQLHEATLSLTSAAELTAPESYYPYSNKSTYALGLWQNNGVTRKSQGEFERLVDTLLSGDVKLSELHGVNWHDINNRLTCGPNAEDTTGSQTFNKTTDSSSLKDSGWGYSPVSISVPFHAQIAAPGRDNYEMKPGFLHRSIIAVIKEKLEDPDYFANFHTEPYELLWQPNDAQPPMRVHGELYSSEAFLQAHCEIREGPGKPGCKLERVVIALMFASDATYLTQFGETKLWPLYLAFGNDSKYLRIKPTNKLFEIIAFFEQVGLPGNLFLLLYKCLNSSHTTSKNTLQNKLGQGILMLHL
jgi:hypothetical protein